MTEEEFLSLAENLRPWTKRAMKIEVAPWIKDYVTEMQELYCELILEEVACKPFGLDKTIIEHYSILFDKALVPAKILGKGDPGMGKTTWGKKIAWDWAKKDFKKFSLILFVFLKLVHPNDTIEYALIDQIPELEGLNVSPTKLESFIEHFGERCLLILDGLDEHAYGSNNDVRKVLQHRKYLNCNILVTSRPHSTAEIQGSCQTVVSVEGFTPNEARKFASSIVNNERAVEQILDFNPTGGKEDIMLHKCPILLSFMCILVRENAVDLTNKTMPTGEIYTRMIQCLYKKFTIRRGIRYDVGEFTKVVGLVGKLAWETLLSGNPLFERSRVEREVGKDVFDYGFLIGNEDLIGDVTADILITFPHRSIQEFFGSFFFVLQLIEGKGIDSILGDGNDDPIFMNNPLFLHFVFWFLSDKCGENYFSLDNRDTACEILHSYIYHKIHRLLGSTEITVTFPAIDFQKALETKDKVNIEHFERILERFHRIKYLTVPDDDVNYIVNDWILNHTLFTCNALTVVAEGELHESLHWVLPEFVQSDGDILNILLSEEAYNTSVLECLCERAAQLKKEPSVYLYVTKDRRIELCDVLHQKMRKLHIINTYSNTRLVHVINTSLENSSVLANEKPISCPILTHLSIIEHVVLHGTAFVALNKALRDGKLPLLQSLCFTGVCLKNKLKYLFDGETVLPSMIHLNLCDCNLSEEDFRDLHVSSNNGLLPKVTSLDISDNILSLKARKEYFLSQSFINLTSLSVKNLTKSSFNKLMERIAQSTLINLKKLCLFLIGNETCNLDRIKSEKVPFLEHLSFQRCITSEENLKQLSRLVKRWDLQTLDISHSRDIQGKLSILMRHNFPSLRTLVLHDCDLNKRDMCSLSKAKNRGKLSKLENLDLSENFWLINCFCAFTPSYRSLKRLRIDCKPISSRGRNGFDILHSLLEIGCIPAIEELRLTSGINLVPASIGHWQHLKRLDIVGFPYTECRHILDSLANAVERGDLPALKIVGLLTSRTAAEELSYNTAIFSLLKKKDVDVFIIDPYLEKIMT